MISFCNLVFNLKLSLILFGVSKKQIINKKEVNIKLVKSPFYLKKQVLAKYKRKNKKIKIKVFEGLYEIYNIYINIFYNKKISNQKVIKRYNKTGR